MNEPSLALLIAVRNRLVTTSAVTALVPAASISDRNAAPATFPCVIIGEGQRLAGDFLAGNDHEIFADLHIWVTEAGLSGNKTIEWAIRNALFDGPMAATGYHIVGLKIASTRFLRDPDGKHSHGVVTIRARVMETA